MKFDLTKIQYSHWDKKRNITIPKELTPELAELIGIMVGDGHIGKYIKKGENYQYVHYETEIYGNSDELEYYENYVNPIFKKCFNIPLRIRVLTTEKSVIARVSSKAIYFFFSKIIGIPQVKDKLGVPYCIQNSKDIMKINFLRGYADADFCFTVKYKPNAYPVIQGSSKSKQLILDCSKILIDLGIENNTLAERPYHKRTEKYYPCSRIYINGRKRTSKYLNLIGFSNKMKLKRINEI